MLTRAAVGARCYAAAASCAASFWPSSSSRPRPLRIRLYPAWNGVFGGSTINFLETDAWYHLRLIENQVRNFPWRVTADPYAAPGGQFVPIAPLL